MSIREAYYSEPQTFTSSLDSYEALIGRRPEMYMWYVGFDTSFPLTNVQQVASRGQIPMISWMPNVTSGTPSTNANIIAGLWDTYLDTFATAVKNYGGPVWLRLGFEMNGSWFQWGATNFVGMWARVQDRFRAQAVTNVTWVWSPNVVDPSYIPLDQVFPGVSRVDVVGLDGYNWGSPTTAGHTADWRMFAEIFDESITQVRALAPGKPFWITEMASSGLGGSKAAWISDALAQIRNYGLDGWIWFNAAKAGEPDFRVNSSASSLAAMRGGYLYASPAPQRSARSGGRVPLVVRLVTAHADRDITADLQGPPSFRSGQYGYASATLSLSRPLSRDAAEIAPFGRVYITDGRHGGTVWEGYQEDPGKGVGGDGQVWEISALGPSARAEDRSQPYISVDGQFGEWDRGAAYGGVDQPLAQIDAQGGAGETPGLRIAFGRGMVIPVNGRAAVTYPHMLASGQRLARLDATHWEGVSGVWDQTWQVRDSGGVGISTGSQVWSTSSQSMTALIVTDFSAVTPMAQVTWMSTNGTGGTVGNDVTWSFTSLLRLQPARKTAAGTDLLTAADYPNSYVLGHQIVADLLGRILTAYDGANARIDTSTYQIDQFAFKEGATARQIIDALIELEPAYYFAAWESPPCIPYGKHRAEWRLWPTSVRYVATTVDGYSAPSSVADLYDRVTVRWIDERGRRRQTVRLQTVPTLADAGISRQGYIDLGSETGSLLNATRAGDNFLAEHALASAAGSLTVARPILDVVTGRMVQPWEILPNTLIRISDLAGRPDAVLATARDGQNVCRVAATNYDGGSASATLELDTYPRSTMQALARLTRTARR